MLRPIRPLRKSTIVRFGVLASAVLGAACSGAPQRLGMSPDCPPVSTRICEAFGPQGRCRCTDARALHRDLERLAAHGVSAW